MRKRTVAENGIVSPSAVSWLAVELFEEVEITSELPEFPIEAALAPSTRGWRAVAPGRQTIRLRFSAPQDLSRIRIVVEEASRARTQEFVLRWSNDGSTFTDTRRQQFNFAPPAVTQEIEEYQLPLHDVRAIELEITPDISGGAGVASLKELRVA